jgi:hypothetical protein
MAAQSGSCACLGHSKARLLAMTSSLSKEAWASEPHNPRNACTWTVAQTVSNTGQMAKAAACQDSKPDRHEWLLARQVRAFATPALNSNMQNLPLSNQQANLGLVQSMPKQLRS